MSKGWYGNSQAHSLASKGIKSNGKIRSFMYEEEPYERYLDYYTDKEQNLIKKVIEIINNADNEYGNEEDVKEGGIFDVPLSLSKTQLAKKVQKDLINNGFDKRFDIKNITSEVVEIVARDGRFYELDWRAIIND